MSMWAARLWLISKISTAAVTPPEWLVSLFTICGGFICTWHHHYSLSPCRSAPQLSSTMLYKSDAHGSHIRFHPDAHKEVNLFLPANMRFGSRGLCCLGWYMSSDCSVWLILESTLSGKNFVAVSSSGRMRKYFRADWSVSLPHCSHCLSTLVVFHQVIWKMAVTSYI